jgi:hypothetical protein
MVGMEGRCDARLALFATLGSVTPSAGAQAVIQSPRFDFGGITQ